MSIFNISETTNIDGLIDFVEFLTDIYNKDNLSEEENNFYLKYGIGVDLYNAHRYLKKIKQFQKYDHYEDVLNNLTDLINIYHKDNLNSDEEKLFKQYAIGIDLNNVYHFMLKIR